MKRSGDRVIARDRVIGEAAYLGHPERAGAYASASRRTSKALVAGHVASGSSHDAFLPLRRLCQDAWTVLGAVLREIFDESAYERFLLRTNGVRNLTSYRDFMQERDAAMAKKPRCC